MFWEPWLHIKPKPPEPYSRGDRWINRKPQEKAEEAKEKDTAWYVRTPKDKAKA